MLNRVTLGAVAMAACFVLPGCGSAQTPTVLQALDPGAQAKADIASKQDLLYISNYSANDVLVVKYPQGVLVQTLDVPEPWGLCSDSSGDVFVPSLGANEILEYRHGAKTPIATLRAPGEAQSCSVDPTTGNLAVDWFNTSGEGVAIFPNASGSPTNYYTPRGSVFWYCGYDGSGNLFIDGEGKSPLFLAMWEVPVGGGGLLTVDFPGGPPDLGTQVQWDGRYITVEAGGTISRLTFSSQGVTLPGHINGSVVGVTKFTNCLGDVYQSWIQGSTLIVPCEALSRKYGVHAYSYPQGGNPSKRILKPNKRLITGPFYGVTLSLAPSGTRSRR
jgi:starvation-inducible outer membrane lipoprotein